MDHISTNKTVKRLDRQNVLLERLVVAIERLNSRATFLGKLVQPGLDDVTKETEPFDIYTWSARWRREAKRFIIKSDLPIRQRRPLISAGNIRGRPIEFDPDEERYAIAFEIIGKPYPEFVEGLAGICTGVYKAWNIGVKGREILRQAMKDVYGDDVLTKHL